MSNISEALKKTISFEEKGCLNDLRHHLPKKDGELEHEMASFHRGCLFALSRCKDIETLVGLEMFQEWADKNLEKVMDIIKSEDSSARTRRLMYWWGGMTSELKNLSKKMRHKA